MVEIKGSKPIEINGGNLTWEIFKFFFYIQLKGQNKSCSDTEGYLIQINYGEPPQLGTLGLASCSVCNINVIPVFG